MQKYLMLWFIFVLFSSSDAKSADDRYLFSIEEALDKHSEVVDHSIGLYFAVRPQERITTDFGTFVSNRKTNARLKAPETSCSWAFMSAIKSLQQRAKAEGGNAIINIHSFYKKNEFFSEKVYECHDGRNVSGVALKGSVVNIE